MSLLEVPDHMRKYIQELIMGEYEIQSNQRELSEINKRPSTILKPRISLDGNQWCVLHGEDLQSGVAGFGDSPELAMADFDVNWKAKLTA